MKEVDWNEHIGEKVVNKDTGEIRMIASYSPRPSVTLFDENRNRENWIGFCVGSPISKNWELYKELTTTGEYNYGAMTGNWDIGDITFSDPLDNNIQFNTKDCDNIIELRENGDIFVKGKLIENDKEVVDGMRELLGFTKIKKESLSDKIWTQESNPIYRNLPDMVSVKNIKKSVKRLKIEMNLSYENANIIDEVFGPKLT